MTDSEVARLLDNLEYIDQETSAAYAAAADKTHTEDMSREFLFFRDVHDAHVMTFSDLAEENGWPRGGPSDADRFRAESRRQRVAQATDQDSAVEALLDIEQETLEEYRRVLDRDDLPQKVRAILSRHADDEMRHVDYLMRHTPEMSRLTPGSTRFEA